MLDSSENYTLRSRLGYTCAFSVHYVHFTPLHTLRAQVPNAVEDWWEGAC